MSPPVTALVNQIKFAAVFSGAAMLGYVTALGLAWAALQSGLALKLLAPAMARHEQYQLQGELATIKPEALGASQILLIGDQRFVAQVLPRLNGAITCVVLPTASLNTIAAALRGFPPHKFEHVVIQNAAWYWSDAATNAFGPEQSVALIVASRNPQLGISNVRLILESIKSAVAKVKPDHGSTERPQDMRNVSFENPPHWSAAALAELALLVPARGPALWVYDGEAMAPLTSEDFKVGFETALQKGTFPAALGSFVALENLEPIGRH